MVLKHLSLVCLSVSLQGWNIIVPVLCMLYNCPSRLSEVTELNTVVGEEVQTFSTLIVVFTLPAFLAKCATRLHTT